MSDLPFVPRVHFNSKRWNQFYKDFLQVRWDRTNGSTAKLYDEHLSRLFVDPTKTPDQFSRTDIEAYLRRKKADGTEVALTTYNARLNAVNTFYQSAASYIIVFRKKQKPLFTGMNPCLGIVYVAPEIAVERDMTEEEAKRFFAAIPRDDKPQNARDYALFLCFLLTARRNGEISQMRWGDLRQVTFEDGRQGWLYSWKGKARKQRQEREMPIECMQAIQRYLELDGRWSRMKPESPIFRGIVPGQPITTDAVTVIFHRYAEMAGLPQSLCVHSFRYISARLRHKAHGKDLAKTAQDLDHKDPKMTLHYLSEPRKAKSDPIVQRLASEYASIFS